MANFCRLALLLVPLIGCVSVRPIPGDEPPALGENEGLLVLHIDSEVEIESLVFDHGASLVQNLPAGRHLLLFAVRAGDHRWTEIVLPGTKLWGGVRYRIPHDDAYRFHVEPGRTNYPGQFRLHGEVEEKFVSLGGRLAVNRSALALEELLEQYPNTLRRYPPKYGGPERDEFLDFYAKRFIARDGAPGSRAP